jgi:ABC-type Na+ efflux pump permease subunit
MIKKICIGVASFIVLGVMYYAISPLFITMRVDEAAPQSKAVGASTDTVKTETLTNTPTQPTQKLDSESNDVVISTVESKSSAPIKVVTTESAADSLQKETIASVIGTTGHKGEGTVRIIKTETSDVVRYENFKTVNGPDLYVYLAKDLAASEFVNLGELKATEGNVNYEVPVGTNVEDYRYVMVWCKQFGVLFNYADLSVGARP